MISYFFNSYCSVSTVCKLCGGRGAYVCVHMYVYVHIQVYMYCDVYMEVRKMASRSQFCPFTFYLWPGLLYSSYLAMSWHLSSVSNFSVGLLALKCMLPHLALCVGSNSSHQTFIFYLPIHLPSTTITAYQGHQNNK